MCLWTDRYLSEGCSQIIARTVEGCPGYCDRASGPFKAMADTEVPGQVPFFKVLNPWIENAPQVSIIEDAKEWFVVGGN